MKLKDMLSKNSFYYFFKDDKSLDLTNFKDITSAEKNFIQGNFTYENFARIGENIKLGTEHLILLKTNKGSILFHKFDSIDYIKEFLLKNSKGSSCAFFGSSQDSGTQIIGIANDNEIKRLIYNSTEKSAIEGHRDSFENKKDFSFKIGLNKKVVKVFDNKKEEINITETDVFDYSKYFLGFDIKSDDIEILDFKFYMFQPMSSVIDENIIFDINKNLSKFKGNEIKISFLHFKKLKHTCLLVLNPFNKNQYIYAQKIFNLNQIEEVKKDFNRVLNFCKESDFINEIVSEDLKTIQILKATGLKYSEVNIIINANLLGDIKLTNDVSNSKQLSQKKILKNTIIFNEYKDIEFDVIYNYLIKNLLSKKDYKLLMKK